MKKKGQKTQKKLDFQLKNKENMQTAGLKSCFWALSRDKSIRIGIFGSSGGKSGFGLQIGTVPTRSGRLASMQVLHHAVGESLEVGVLLTKSSSLEPLLHFWG